MKKILLIIMCLLFTLVTHSTIYEYVDKSGRSFFYRVPVPYSYENRNKRTETGDEIAFIMAQGFSCSIASNDPNYNEDKMFEELKLIFRDSVLVLYNQNKGYMEQNFPGHTYTFDEVYEFAVSVADVIYWLNCDYKCYINMSLSMRDVIKYSRRRKIVENNPYILGYLYQEEKYHDGKKCKLKKLSGVRIN